MNFNEIRWAICIPVKAKLVLNDAWSSFYLSFKSWMRTVGSWTIEHALIEPKLWWLYLLSCLVIVKKLGAGGSYFLLEIYYISFRSLFFYIWHLFICLFYLFPLCNLVTWFKNSIWFFSINPPLTYFYENDTHQYLITRISILQALFDSLNIFLFIWWNFKWNNLWNYLFSAIFNWPYPIIMLVYILLDSENFLFDFDFWV